MWREDCKGNIETLNIIREYRNSQVANEADWRQRRRAEHTSYHKVTPETHCDSLNQRKEGLQGKFGVTSNSFFASKVTLLMKRGGEEKDSRIKWKVMSFISHVSFHVPKLRLQNLQREFEYIIWVQQKRSEWGRYIQLLKGWFVF